MTTTGRSGDSIGAIVASLTGRSDSIGALVAALAAARAEMGAVGRGREVTVRTRDGNSYSYAYATLAECVEAVRQPFAKAGLAVIQTTHTEGDGLVLLSVLAHSSGEWVSASLPVRPVAEGPQALGSALTYARRYGLALVAGLASEDEDDDGAAAQPADGRTYAVVERAAGGTFRFGRLKGQPIAGCQDREGLEWYARALTDSIADPGKAAYRSSNERSLAEVEAAIAALSAPAAPVETPPATAEAAKVTGADRTTLEHWRAKLRAAFKLGVAEAELEMDEARAKLAGPADAPVLAQLEQDYRAGLAVAKRKGVTS